MPLYREWISDTHSLIAIWKIEEEEHFFAERTKYSSSIKNDKKRIEHLAGRMLLKHLKEDFPILDIKPDQYDKPRLDDNKYFFSISHSFPYVAAIISDKHEKGIDIQCWRHNIEVLQHKFLSPAEQSLFENKADLITVAWTAKEAAYKYIGQRGVDFIKQLQITKHEKFSNAGAIQILPKIAEINTQLDVYYLVEEDFSCSYI